MMMPDTKLIRKITAPNGGVFTGGGTNTYIIGNDDLTLVDPGPNIEEHSRNILDNFGKKISRIIVTHTHMDHSPCPKPRWTGLSCMSMSGTRTKRRKSKFCGWFARRRGGRMLPVR